MDPEKSRKASGAALALFSSAAFGMIPLFSLPLFRAGVPVQSVLFYRFFIAALVIWLILMVAKERILAPAADLLKLFFLSFLYMMAVVVFFHAFSFLPSGVVATIQFLYPVMVMLIMILFFHEKFRPGAAAAAALAFGGVAALSLGQDSGAAAAQAPGGISAAAWGVALSLLSGLCNGLYIIGLQTVRIPHVNGLLMTFYVMLFGALISLVNAMAMDSLRWIGAWREAGLVFLLALVTAVLSNLALILAVKRVGSTLTSILGVMEPLTAVVIGIAVFHEPLTWHLAAGVFLIAASVFLAVGGPAKSA